MIYTLLSYLYSSLFLLAMPVVVAKKLFRGRQNKAYRTRWAERFGYVKLTLSESIWVHCVSVGESISVAPLVKKLARNYPNKPFVITTMTPTGSAQVKRLYQEEANIFHSFVPYDVPLFLTRFLKRVNPKLCIIMETELWPNLIACCEQKGIPVIVTNARLSQKSAAGYHRISFITRAILRQIDFINAQSKTDAERFIALSCDPKKIAVTGNLKYDFNVDGKSLQAAQKLKEAFGKRPIWIAASTHPKEDEIILAAHEKIQARHQDALLILVPRHPERFEQVYTLIQQHGFRSERHSCANAEGLKGIDVYLGDSMGEMMLFYAICDIAFVGGSFSGTGGHNMLEPAALAKPILSGPSVFNFAEVARRLCESGALFIVADEKELTDKVIEFIEQPEFREASGARALACFKHNQGALDKQYRQIEKYLHACEMD